MLVGELKIKLNPITVDLEGFDVGDVLKAKINQTFDGLMLIHNSILGIHGARCQKTNVHISLMRTPAA